MTKQATKKRRQPKPPTATEPPQLGSRLRELRKAKQLTLRQLADRVDVGFTYLSKIENGKLETGHCPSDQLITRMAEELDADEIELLLLAEKIPDPIRRRFIERPEAFALLAKLKDADLDRVVSRVKQLVG
ncbi:MAG: helix-turn-helix transcriptional regulator [Pirellulaceae bacterium]